MTGTARGRSVRKVGAGPILVLVTAGALVLAGCTREDDPPASEPTFTEAPPPTTATSTPSASRTSTPRPTPPPLPAAAKRPTPAGATAFFRHFWDVYNYGYSARDPAPLRRVSTPTCKSCLAYASGIEEAARQGYIFRGGEVKVIRAIAAPGAAAQGLLVNAVVTQRASTTLDSEDKIIASSPQRPRYRIDAAVRWDGSRWVMLAMDSKGR